tara:strand:- start:12972 stop:13355 length:384 start_codon:yes stop_codon:yes gene_type:complete
MLRRNFDRRAQSFGLTRSQWMVLMHLKRKNGMRQNELAKLLEIKPISITRLIDRLVKDDWVERRDDPVDRRAKRIYLTDKVEPLIGKLRDIGLKIREESLLGISNEQREVLMKMLVQIRTNVAEPKD